VRRDVSYADHHQSGGGGCRGVVAGDADDAVGEGEAYGVGVHVVGGVAYAVVWVGDAAGVDACVEVVVN